MNVASYKATSILNNILYEDGEWEKYGMQLSHR